MVNVAERSLVMMMEIKKAYCGSAPPLKKEYQLEYRDPFGLLLVSESMNPDSLRRVVAARTIQSYLTATGENPDQTDKVSSSGSVIPIQAQLLRTQTLHGREPSAICGYHIIDPFDSSCIWLQLFRGGYCSL